MSALNLGISSEYKTSWYSRWIESDGKREFVLLAGGREGGTDGSEQLSYTITDMGGVGEHSIRDWRDSAKYLDTTLPLKELLDEEIILKERLSNYFRTSCSFVCFCNLVS